MLARATMTEPKAKTPNKLAGNSCEVVYCMNHLLTYEIK